MSKRRSSHLTRGAHVIERNGRFYAYLPPETLNGKPRRVTLDTRDRRVADQRLAEIVAGRRTPGVDAVVEETLARISEQYLTAPHGWTKRTESTCTARVAAWIDWCDGRKITRPSQLTGNDAQAWVREQIAAKRKHATINRNLVVVRKMLRWASHPDRALCGETPFHRLEQLREDRRAAPPIVPSPDEVARVIGVIDARGHTRPIVVRGKKQPARERTRADKKFDAQREARLGACWVAISLATGARISEVGGLDALQLHPGAWVVPPSKGHTERTIPLGDEVERVARELVDLLGSTKARNGRPVTINERWALDLLGWACAEAEVPVFKPHDLRRTFATECRREGVPLTTLRVLMGHKDTQITERYLGRYRSDASVKVPTPRALVDLLKPNPGTVLPFRRG